ASPPARADRANDLAAYHDGHSALGGNRFFRKGEECGVAGCVLIGKGLARPPEYDGRPCVGLRNLGGSELRAIHALEINELTCWSDNRNSHMPIILPGFRDGGRRHTH